MAAWIVIVEWLARLILVLLVGLSIWSIAIMIERKKFFEALFNQDQNKDLGQWIRAGERAKVLEWSQKNQGLRAGTIRAALDRKSADQMEKAVASFIANERAELEKGLPVLGTLGSTTPFVGLFGTIMGIIVAFGALSSGQMDSQKVMYALAEALILTAVGLAVAIPAVVAFNYFSRKLGALLRDCESLKDLLVSYFAEK